MTSNGLNAKQSSGITRPRAAPTKTKEDTFLKGSASAYEKNKPRGGRRREGTTQDQPEKLGGRWSVQEHSTFLEALRLYGDNWIKLQELIPTRNRKQLVSHTQKYYEKLKRHQIKKCRQQHLPYRPIFAIVRIHRDFSNFRVKTQYEIILDEPPVQSTTPVLQPHSDHLPSPTPDLTPPLKTKAMELTEDWEQVVKPQIHVDTLDKALDQGFEDPLAFLDGWSPDKLHTPGKYQEENVEASRRGLF